MPLDQPGRVVSLAEGEQRLTQLLDRSEASHPQQVLLQRADEALGAAVALRRSHESRRALGAQEAELLLEVVGHVLAPVVVPDGKATGDALRKPAEVAPHALTERLERLEAVGAAAGMDADALGRAVVDGGDCSVTVSAARVSSLQGGLAF